MSVVVAVWWIACLLWSAGWLFLKVGLRDIPPITFAASRLGLALVVLIAIVTLRKEWRALKAADLPAIATSGLLLLGVNYALTFSARDRRRVYSGQRRRHSSSRSLNHEIN